MAAYDEFKPSSSLSTDVIVCGHCTFLCELLSFIEQTVEDGAEVTQQSLAVLQQL